MYLCMYAWMHAPMIVQGAVQGIVRGDQHTLFHMYNLQLHHSDSHTTSYSTLTFYDGVHKTTRSTDVNDKMTKSNSFGIHKS